MSDTLQTIFETKRYDWSKYQPFLLGEVRDDFLKQLGDHVRRYPESRQIIFVFDSQFGAVPDLIRNGPEDAGSVVMLFP